MQCMEWFPVSTWLSFSCSYSPSLDIFTTQMCVWGCW